ncbi:hypothetical protein HJ01_01771 [Flavobacterium frigoris PS1]|uniref:Uncharacterized protein n=1 Tax=Flavobacterium frigoris (strain PS1) TaxID=1086011 RepID=H7FRM2_FLAFP|nr:hypothetical protein HJ01_01771 [Flavobacterium frigoris PS1]
MRNVFFFIECVGFVFAKIMRSSIKKQKLFSVIYEVRKKFLNLF